MEIDWKIVVPVIGALVGLITLFITIFFKRHELTSLKHKKISDRLSSSTQYFQKYYEEGQTNQLELDRAAQDLAKCVFVNHALVNKLIDYHQNFLVDFDEMIFIFEDGHHYIQFKKDKNLNVRKDLEIKTFWNLGIKVRKGLFVLGYFIFALLGILLFSGVIFLATSGVKVSLILNIAFILVSILFIFLAFFFLLLEDRLRQADRFIQKIYEADTKYKKIEKPKRIILLSRNEKPS